ncbi:MAG TPA: NAD(P)H-binding protein [Terracidiphilus sp.]|jgi:uncharacterized protein YbjT (DUF2867 family)|nr:NAD(P)H-binding protein [Terracidiphilus sp.]
MESWKDEAPEGRVQRMKVLIFGATGMVGQGVLHECLRDADVEQVAAIGRSATGIRHARFTEIVHADLASYASVEDRLRGFDACFFCLGVSSAGMKERDYERVTYGFTMAAAETLSRLNPGMSFVFVSGAGTDSTEKGRVMWARVKGRTENALLRLPLNAWMFRPGIIQPLDGIRSKTAAYRLLYGLMRPLLPLLRRAMPNQIVTTREIGRAMLNVARRGYPKHILETRDLRIAAAS